MSEKVNSEADTAQLEGDISDTGFYSIYEKGLQPMTPDPNDTEPPSIPLDVHNVLTLAAEIAADEGHSATISTDNVQEAFDKLTGGNDE